MTLDEIFLDDCNVFCSLTDWVTILIRHILETLKLILELNMTHLYSVQRSNTLSTTLPIKGPLRYFFLFSGIGVATTVIVFLLNIYYNVILAWAFYYLFASFTNVLPWSHCNNDWNTDKCVVNVNQPVTNSTHNQTVLTAQPTNYTSLTAVVTSVYESVITNVSEVARLHTDPVSEFWE